VLLEMLFSVLISQSTTQGLEGWRFVGKLTCVKIYKRFKYNIVFLHFVKSCLKITLAVSLGRNEEGHRCTLL